MSKNCGTKAIHFFGSTLLSLRTRLSASFLNEAVSAAASEDIDAPVPAGTPPGTVSDNLRRLKRRCSKLFKVSFRASAKRPLPAKVLVSISSASLAIWSPNELISSAKPSTVFNAATRSGVRILVTASAKSEIFDGTGTPNEYLTCSCFTSP